MKKIIINFLIGAFVFGGISFYAGTKYSQGGRGNFSNLSSEERQRRFQELGTAGAGSFRGGRMGGQGGEFVGGEILSKDDKSFTVKLREGGSKIIFFSSSTEINKSAKGSPQDLGSGVQVLVNGTANSDGSLTAQTVQIR